MTARCVFFLERAAQEPLRTPRNAPLLRCSRDERNGILSPKHKDFCDSRMRVRRSGGRDSIPRYIVRSVPVRREWLQIDGRRAALLAKRRLRAIEPFRGSFCGGLAAPLPSIRRELGVRGGKTGARTALALIYAPNGTNPKYLYGTMAYGESAITVACYLCNTLPKTLLTRAVQSGSFVACARTFGNCDVATEGGIPRSSRT